MSCQCHAPAALPARYTSSSTLGVPHWRSVIRAAIEIRVSECPASSLDYSPQHCLLPFSRRAETERDGTRAETRFGFPAKRTSPFKSAGVSVQSSAGRRGVRISGSNAG